MRGVSADKSNGSVSLKSVKGWQVMHSTAHQETNQPLTKLPLPIYVREMAVRKRIIDKQPTDS